MSTNIITGLGSLIWPLVILILFVVYRKSFVGLLHSLTDLISHSTKAGISASGIIIETDKQLSSLTERGEKTADALGEIADQVKSIFQQGKSYNDYTDAFGEAERNIKDFINDKIKEGENEPLVQLKLICVAMTFSWHFIVVKLHKILVQYSTAKISLEVLFVDWRYIKSLDIANSGVHWSEESKQRENEIRNFARSCEQEFGGRFTLSAKTYKSIPMWHGWLVNGATLYMGRTSWQFGDERPRLLVGQNMYRLFNDSSHEGSDRIKLYESWHRFYWKYASEFVYPSVPLSEGIPDD